MIITERKIDKAIFENKDILREFVVTKAEFSSLILCSKDIRYKYTLKRIVDTETVCILSSKEDNIIMFVNEGEIIIPLWSSKNYGLSFCQNHLEGCDCKAISLYDFLDILESWTSDCNLMLGVFPTINDIIGCEVSPDAFIKSIDAEQEWY